MRLLLVRQFVCIAVVAIAFALVLIFHDYGGVGAILLLIVATRLSKGVEKTLRETDVRLTRPQKHIYFGAGLVYFVAIVGAVLWYALRHSSPPVWSLTSLALVVLLVLLYAGAELVYGSKSRV